MAAGTVLAPAKTMHQMGQIVFNDYVDATLAGVFAALVVTMVIYGIIHCRKAMGTSEEHHARDRPRRAGRSRR